MYQPKYSEKSIKGEIRSLLLQYLPERKYNRVVTLPCLNFDLEYKLNEQGYKVHTVESNVIIYKQQKELSKNTRIYNYNLNTVEFFTSTKRDTVRYDFAYLDFCSQITKGVITSIMYSKATVLGVTLMMKRESYAKHLFKQLGRENYYKHIFNTIGYKIINKIKYIGGYNSPMCTFILTKI